MHGEGRNIDVAKVVDMGLGCWLGSPREIPRAGNVSAPGASQGSILAPIPDSRPAVPIIAIGMTYMGNVDVKEMTET